jgi:hypothetical protein
LYSLVKLSMLTGHGVGVGVGVRVRVGDALRELVGETRDRVAEVLAVRVLVALLESEGVAPVDSVEVEVAVKEPVAELEAVDVLLSLKLGEVLFVMLALALAELASSAVSSSAASSAAVRSGAASRAPPPPPPPRWPPKSPRPAALTLPPRWGARAARVGDRMLTMCGGARRDVFSDGTFFRLFSAKFCCYFNHCSHGSCSIDIGEYRYRRFSLQRSRRREGRKPGRAFPKYAAHRGAGWSQPEPWLRAAGNKHAERLSEDLKCDSSRARVASTPRQQFACGGSAPG